MPTDPGVINLNLLSAPLTEAPRVGQIAENPNAWDRGEGRQTGITTQDSVVTGYTSPWHGLCEPFGRLLTLDEAFHAVGLDTWEPILLPAYAGVPREAAYTAMAAGTAPSFDGSPYDRRGGSGVHYLRPVDGAQFIARSDTFQILGNATDRYVPAPNRAPFDALARLTERGDLGIESAGTLYGGRIVWALAATQEDDFIDVGGVTVQPYLLATNGHDGHNGFSITATGIVVVCQNTWTRALGGTNVWRARHTSDVSGRFDEAGRILGMASAQRTALADEVTRWLEVGISDDTVGQVVEMIAPTTTPGISATTRTKREQIQAGIYSTWMAEYDDPAVRESAWGLVNAISSWEHHQRPLRVPADDQRARAEAVAARSLRGKATPLADAAAAWLAESGRLAVSAR
jgi:phage/plasmid-like protein (TIGR03299 family)